MNYASLLTGFSGFCGFSVSDDRDIAHLITKTADDSFETQKLPSILPDLGILFSMNACLFR